MFNWAYISGERLQDHWSSGNSLQMKIKIGNMLFFLHRERYDIYDRPIFSFFQGILCLFDFFSLEDILKIGVRLFLSKGGYMVTYV